MRLYRRNLVLLGLVVALAAVDAALERPGPVEREVGRLFPDLYVDRAARLSLARGDERLDLARDADGRWTVEQLGGYPGFSDQIDLFLTRLSSVTNLDLLTDRPTAHAEYGVDDAGIAVRIEDERGAELAAFVQGLEVPREGASYLRLAAGAEVYRVLGLRALALDPLRQWVDPRLVDVEPILVRRLTLAGPLVGDDAIAFERVEGTTDAWTRVGRGRAPRDQVALALRDLKRVFLDAVEGADPGGISDPRLIVELELRDGALRRLVFGAEDADGAVRVQRGGEPWLLRLSPATWSAVAAMVRRLG